MRVLPLLSALLLWAVATALVFVAHDGVRAWAMGGPTTWAATALGAVVALTAGVFALVADERRAALWGVAAGVTLLPWIVGVLGTSLSIGTVNAALAQVAPDQAGPIGAMGYAESMMARLIGAASTAGPAAGLALGGGVVWLAVDRSAGHGASLVGALTAGAIALGAIGSAMRAIHAGDVCHALALVAPEDRAALMAAAAHDAGPTVALGLAVLAVVGAAGALAVLRSKASIVAWVALGGAAALLAAEALLEARHGGLCSAVRTAML